MTYELTLLEREEQGEERGRENAIIANLHSVMRKLNISAENAMDFLDVPKEEQSYYASKLNESIK